MTKLTVVLFLVLGLAVPAVVAADVIRLKNGHSLPIEGWRDAGDQIEFAAGGGIVRISKAEVDKIEGQPHRGDFKMYTSGTSSSVASAAEQADAVKKMKDLLGQGDTMFGQATLSAREKAGTFRRLAEQWEGFDVPESVRDTHDRGRAALIAAADAFSADPIDPDTRTRVEKARRDFQSVYDDVKKLGGAS